jgi:conjugal transfer pilus assembly protein TrbC
VKAFDAIARIAARGLLLAPLLAGGGWIAPAGAAGTASVGDGDGARATPVTPVITDEDVRKAQEKFAMPSDADLSRVPLPAAPRLEALPRPATPRRIDLGALAKGYEANREEMAAAQDLMTGPKLLVFVSFAMPAPSLERLVDQAARAQASLVIRGLVNGNLRDTVMRVQRLIGKRRVGFLIDPPAFDRFGVTATPTFVLVRADAQATSCGSAQCYADDAYAAEAGDVSLDYALDFIIRSAPPFAADAQRFLDRIRG